VKGWRLWLTCLLILAFSLGIGAAHAQEPVSLSQWRDCRRGATRLLALHAALRAAADTLAAQRMAAATRGDAAVERMLLARGEALADSLEQVATALLGAELRCAPLAQALLEEIDAARVSMAGAEPVMADSLRRLRDEVAGASTRSSRAEFALPEVGESDPPEILRQKAAYAQDLADRAARWLEIVAREERALAQERLSRDATRLMEDEAFFDDRVTLGVDRAPGGLGDASSSTLRGLFEQVDGVAGSVLTTEAVLTRLRAFLTAERDASVLRAEELEREAARREREQ
jgi:hypothetical protein